MKLIYRLFHINPDSRDGIIVFTSGLGIVVNVLIALSKIVIGTLASSIAIVSEGINNATDALTSILALLGTKLAQKHPDEKHPFGYGRIEYLASLTIAVLIIVTGLEMLKSAVELIFEPEEMSVSYIALVIILVTAVIKFILAIYTIKVGKKTGSGALIGVGEESRNDSYASVITIVSSVVFLIFHISLDAYAGIIISALIIKGGISVLMETLSDLIGRPGAHELASTIYKEIRETDEIIAAADMMLHNYGPDSWSGSVNVEIDHNKTVGEIYEFLHQLQLDIMHRHHVIMVFGVYAVDNDNNEIREIRQNISEFVKSKDQIKSYHAVYIDPKSDIIYCDFIVDYSKFDWNELEKEFTEYMNQLYPTRKIELTIETEYV